MFCPKCKAEYRDGFYKCTDCGVDLVYELPGELQTKYTEEPPGGEAGGGIKYKDIYSTFNAGEIAFIKSLLQASNIRYFVQGENFAYVRGFVQPAIIMVDETQHEDAENILKDFKDKGAG